MTKSFKKRLDRAIAVVMAVAMLVGTLPADLLGGIASVKAADESMVLDASKLTAGDITATTKVGDFTLNIDEAANKMTIDGNKKSINGVSYTQRLKTNGAGSVTKRSISFATTGAATVTVHGMSGSSSEERTLVLANSAGVVATSDAIDGASLHEITFNITEAGTYYLYSGKSSFSIYGIYVTPVATEDENTNDGGDKTEMVPFERTYNLLNGELIPNTVTADATTPITSDDGMMKLEGTYKWHGGGHGPVIKPGSVLTFYAGEGAKITNIAIGGCQYTASDAVGTLTAGDTEVAKLNLQTAGKCDKAAGTNLVEFAYDGDATELKLSISGSNVVYCPLIVVKGMEPKAAAEMVSYERTYNLLNGELIPNTVTADATTPITSGDGMLKLEGTYKWHGGGHGPVIKPGSVLTFYAGEGAKITSIAIGGCQYTASDAVGTLTAGDTEVAKLNLQTAGKCDKAAGTNLVEFAYDGDATELKLSISGSNVVYCPLIVVKGMEPKPEATEVTATIDVSDPDALLGADDKITLTAKGATEGIDITKGGDYTLAVKTEYEIKTNNTDIAATVDGKASVKTDVENVKYTVAVTNTTVKVVPTITGDELGEYSLYAVAGENAYKLENGKEAKLPKETKMTLEVRDASDKVMKTWLAKVKDAATFTTESKTLEKAQEIAVVITEVKDVKVTPTITGIGLLGENTVYLVNGDDKLAVVNGQAMTLKPMTKYNVVLDAEGIEATIKASKTFETGVEDVEITVAVSTPPSREIVYDFAKSIINADNKKTHTVGEILPGTDKVLVSGTTDVYSPGILYAEKKGSNAVKYDSQLRFYVGTVLYLPIKDDTTKVTLIMNFSATNANRQTYVGDASTGYVVEFSKGDSSVTVPDITDMIVEKNGQKYLPIESGGDVKPNAITLVEYNPINDVTVTGTIEGAAEAGVKKVNFKNMDNENAELVTADVDANGNYSAVLRRVDGMTTYAATITVTGYKIQDENDADKFTLIGNGAAATANFAVAESPISTVSGKITGLNDFEIKGELGARLIPDNKAISPIELELYREGIGTYAFSPIVLDIGRTYTVELINIDDYEVLAPVVIAEGEEAVIEIKATAKPLYAVNGRFVTSDDKDSDVTEITFTNIDTPNYSYSFDVTNGIYSAELRTGTYKTTVVSENYEAFDHVVVADKSVANDVYLQGAVDNSAVAYKATIEIGEGKDFTSIADAIAYISRMDRTASERVTIVLEKDKVYREQLVINTPNITIEGNGATITWYYGVGFSYYSAKLSADGKSAYYDEAYAVDRYTMQAISQNPGHWGATVNLLAGASGFKAENLTFENSLNRYLTTEELWDGADANADAAVTHRTEISDEKPVTAKAAKERACVLYIQADNTEYNNCKLLSRQDTLYTGDATENSYFKNCLIEGNVDYLCGDGKAVFDACTLSMYGYSDTETTGNYIVANKAKANPYGYLFDNCKIVDAATTNKALKATSANVLARAWDAGSVYWMNTQLEKADMIADDAYADMNAKSADANYNEYNTYYIDEAGKEVAVDLSKRTDVKILKAEEAAAVKMTDWFGDWVPSYYAGEFNVTISELALNITAPAALAATSTDVTCAQPGVVLGKMAWYVGDKEFTGESFGGETAYTAKLTATLEKNYVFADKVTVNVKGAETATVEVKDGVATIAITFTKTGPEGYYEIDLSNGLKKGVQYDGGITVMEDMAAKTLDKAVEIDGNSYDVQVQGSGNPAPNKGEIPASGAVLVVEAIRDGVLVVAIKSTGGKAIHFVSETGEDYFADGEKPSENKIYKLPVKKGLKYYFYGDGTKIVYFGITADYRVIERAAWSTVATPEVVGIAVGKPGAGTVDGEDLGTGDGADGLKANAGEINVRVKGWVDDVNGADTVVVDMVDEKGNVIQTRSSSKKNKENDPITELTFEPKASGNYAFVPRLTRAEEEDKVGKTTKAVDFVLPMGHASIVSVTNKCTVEEVGTNDGADKNVGALEVIWDAVTEAEKYEVIVDKVTKDKDGKTVTTNLATVETTATTAMVEKLPIDTDVVVSVVAIGKDKENRSTPDYDDGDKMDIKVEKRFDRTWAFTAYGSSISLDKNLRDNTLENNGYKKNEDGSVTVYSVGGKGKVVPGSTDGLAFYYTTMNPLTENFTLTADVHVDKWKLSNGQDGFGLMVSDTVGKNGDGTAFWNNSYQLFATKIEYNWDTNKNAVTNATAGENGVEKYSMKLGLGWIAKEGTTKTDVAKITAGELATPVNFSSTSGTLETTAALAGKGAGTYNIVGNAETAVDGTVAEIVDFKLQIQRNNTGYILRYLDTNGQLLAEKIFYDDDANKLTQIDKKNIYVGFVASRNAQITVSNINLTTIDPLKDEEAQPKEITYVDPSYQVLSSDTSNSEEYELVYYGNVDGTLTIVDADGDVVANGVSVSAKKKYSFKTALNKGDNKFELVVVPDKNYSPGENQLMSNYDRKAFSFHVKYQEFANDIIYVAPAGKAKNDGTKENPVDIYTAVAYAKAGQKIYLVGGTYKLKNPVLIDRGHDGTEKNPIYMMADPSDIARPVFNFARQTENTSAMTVAGNYWYLKGFDVTESKDAQKGIQVSGNYNVLEDIDAYKNGNTGIQISRYLGTDNYDQWPAYNTILNCTSYLNADAGYEDADGFAAKLTVADGNKFVGCIAAYNADDGWDLFAKVQSGSIGAVTIEDSLAFKNGYVLGYAGKNDEPDTIDENGGELSAGNGNGFKMGGDSMSGYHVIKNSVAFANKAKGIDSNSCPDIQVYNCTSFENESYNVAMYTNTAVKTDYYATGVLSMKVENKVAEQIKPVGTQKLAKIYSNSNYYFDGAKSANASGELASLDWFKSIDVNAAISGAKAIYREADGSINMNGFLELTDKAPAGVGARLSNTSAAVVLEKVADVNVYASTVKTLADVKLPAKVSADGYSWKYPKTETAVFAGTSAEFVISAEGKQDKAVVVNFIEVTGVAISADKTALVGNETMTLTARPVLAPAVVLDATQDGADYKYEFSGSQLNIDSKGNVATVSRTSSTKNGTAKVTVNMTATVDGKNVAKKADYSFIVSKGKAEISYTTDGADVVDGAVTLDKGEKFTLKDVKAVGDIDNAGVKVSVNDTKVVTLDSKTNTITAVGEGTATITMTATADKNVCEELIVVVRGDEFKTNVSTITVDKSKTIGAQITALGCYGAKVDPKSVTIKKVTKGSTIATKYFTVDHVVGNVYNISTVDDVDGLSNGVYTMVLRGTVDGKAKNFEEITVKVVETKPSASIKQTKKVNLFYNAGTTSNSGALTATSKQAKVILTQTNTRSSAYRLVSTKNGYNIVLKKAMAAEAKKNNKIQVVVSYAGYKAAYNKDLTISVKTENKAPKLVLEVNNKTLYTALGIKDTNIRILDKATNTYVEGADVKLADDKSSYVAANKNFTLTEEAGEYTLTTTKSGSAKISVQDADWSKAVILNQRITVTDKMPKVTFKTVKLNTAAEFAGMEMASSEVAVKDALDITVADVELTGKNKAQSLLEYLDYSVEVDEYGKNVLNISLKKALPTKANGKCEFSGSYSFDVTFNLNEVAEKQKSTVKISLVPTATITTKQSGSIDLVNRTGSSVMIKPTLKNLNGRIVGAVLNEDACNQFNVEWDSAKEAAIVTVKEDIDMKKGGKYKVTPTFIVETNGGDMEVMAKSIIISPKQSTVKVTKMEALETRLSSTRTAATATFKATSPAKAEILSLQQLSHDKNFKVSYDELSDTVSVKIVNRAGLKAGTTYKIKVAMEVEGAGVNTNAQTTTLTVKVLR